MVHDDGTPTSKTFKHIPSEIDAEEAEEVGVEHLLRDIHNVTAGTLSQRITDQVTFQYILRDYSIFINSKRNRITDQVWGSL